MKFLQNVLGLGFNPFYVAIAAAVLFAAGAASGGVAGWTVASWKASGTIERVKGDNNTLTATNNTLTAANAQCKANVDDVRQGVREVVAEGIKAQKAAEARMAAASTRAQGHLDRAAEILNRPPVEAAKWCETIMREQAEYVEGRRK